MSGAAARERFSVPLCEHILRQQNLRALGLLLGEPGAGVQGIQQEQLRPLGRRGLVAALRGARLLQNLVLLQRLGRAPRRTANF